MQLPPEGSEQLNEMLDPHRKEERSGVAVEIAGRLAQKGIEIDSGEDPALLADTLSAIEQFELAVEKRGGDLFVNSPNSSDPQNPEYVFPLRNADEALESYIKRIIEAAEKLG